LEPSQLKKGVKMQELGLSSLIGLEHQVLFIGSEEAQKEMIKDYPWFKKVGLYPNHDWSLRSLLEDRLSCCCSPSVYLKRSRKLSRLLDVLDVQVVFDGEC
jgi:hypothetical protein